MDNSYLSIACNDYKYVVGARVLNHYNNDAYGCQQVIEKLLKSVAVSTLIEEDKLKTRDLHKLYRLVRSSIELPVDMEYKLCKISDYYLDARYPGDDFTIVSKEESDMCFEVMETIYKLALEFHAKNKSQFDKAVDILAGGE